MNNCTGIPNLEVGKRGSLPNLPDYFPIPEPLKDAPNPESTEAMCAGVDTRVDGQGRANRPGQVPIDGDEGGVK